jgi:hypothetical protein
MALEENMKMLNPKFYAFYLPQFHPIPENDYWYGTGFTEWCNVAMAKPLFIGHYQPRIPADLGFYDLRLKETVIEQAEMARNYGIDGFIYWHYWFGNGKELLEGPFHEVVSDPEININFALAWANETWQKKLWNSAGKDQTIAEQVYPGIDDETQHFYSQLKSFKDKRYIKINGKLLFVIYRPFNFPCAEMIRLWRQLAKKELIDDFYFVGCDFSGVRKGELIKMGFDGVYYPKCPHFIEKMPKGKLFFQKLEKKFLGIPIRIKYKEAMKTMVDDRDKQDEVIPEVLPNWDHTPRSGKQGLVLTDCEPALFGAELAKAVLAVRDKPIQKQIIFIKSWNEWGEGNYVEPDMRYGLSYLKEIKKVKDSIFKRDDQVVIGGTCEEKSQKEREI